MSDYSEIAKTYGARAANEAWLLDLNPETNGREPLRIDTAECAKLVRKALGTAFPGVKFKVRTDRYSGGSAVAVSWTDGPTEKQVDAIAKRYQGASFDGMTDSMHYHTDEHEGRRVRFGADFVQCQRSYSDAFKVRIGERVASKYGTMPPVWTSYRGGELYLESCAVNHQRIDGITDGLDTLHDLVMRTLAKTATQVK